MKTRSVFNDTKLHLFILLFHRKFYTSITAILYHIIVNLSICFIYFFTYFPIKEFNNFYIDYSNNHIYPF